jgi:hypothetical protein
MRNWNVIVHGGTRSTRGFLEGNMGPNFATLSTVFYFILCKYSPGSDKIARSSANPYGKIFNISVEGVGSIQVHEQGGGVLHYPKEAV